MEPHKFTGFFLACIIHCQYFDIFYMVEYIYSPFLFITESSSIIQIYHGVFIYHLLMDTCVVLSLEL